jgi:hypothetical protein
LTIVDLMTMSGSAGGARIRVELQYGYASYSFSDMRRALDLYYSEGIGLRFCRSIFDEGQIVAGRPSAC